MFLSLSVLILLVLVLIVVRFVGFVTLLLCSAIWIVLRQHALLISICDILQHLVHNIIDFGLENRHFITVLHHRLTLVSTYVRNGIDHFGFVENHFIVIIR